MPEKIYDTDAERVAAWRAKQYAFNAVISDRHGTKLKALFRDPRFNAKFPTRRALLEHIIDHYSAQVFGADMFSDPAKELEAPPGARNPRSRVQPKGL